MFGTLAEFLPLEDQLVLAETTHTLLENTRKRRLAVELPRDAAAFQRFSHVRPPARELRSSAWEDIDAAYVVPYEAASAQAALYSLRHMPLLLV